ncbi:MAG: hypothetical protein OEY81_03260 [Candidatus Bathyarchaeota archaeon]|nr:hypothetical protein [Candidatus Bathyarchaeota archaeon]
MKRTVLAFLVVLVLVPTLTPMMLVRAPAGLLLDLTTQKGGTGIGEPSPPFTLGEVVELRTRLTFNDVPEVNSLVGFEVLSPNNETAITRTQFTDNDGGATIEFRVPILLNNVGTWKAFAISEVKGQTAWDILNFTVRCVLPTIESCDVAEAEKNVFDLLESVYACGDNYGVEESVIVYVVPNGGPYTAAASVIDQSAQADTSGHLGPVHLGVFDPGKYDIWVDRAPYDGELYAECEPVDTFSSTVEGFFVIPEYVVGTILSLAAYFVAFAVFSRFKRLNQIKTRSHANLSGSRLFSCYT